MVFYKKIFIFCICPKTKEQSKIFQKANGSSFQPNSFLFNSNKKIPIRDDTISFWENLSSDTFVVVFDGAFFGVVSVWFDS